MTNSKFIARSDIPIYVVLLLAAYLASAGITTVYAMLAMLNRTFNEPLRVGWVITSYFLVGAICAALCGRLGDLFGRRLLFLVALVLCFVGALISAMATDLNGVIVGCAVQGGSGAMIPLAIGIIRENLRRETVPMAVSLLLGAATFTSGISFLAAGYVVDHFSWNGGFYMKAVLALVTFVIVWFCVPKHRAAAGSVREIKIGKGLLFAPAIAAIFIAVEVSVHSGWADTKVVMILSAAILTLVYWARSQLREKTPLINVRSLGNRQVLLANLGMLMICISSMQNMVLMSLFLQQPQWSQTGFDLNATLTGFMALLMNSAALFSAPWAGRVATRYGSRAAALQGAAILCVCWLIIAIFHHSLWLLIAVDIVCMFGLSVTLNSIYNLVVEATPSERTSEATGLTYVFLAVFHAIGAQIVFWFLNTSRIANASLTSATYPSDLAYTRTFLYFTAISIVIVPIILALPRRRSILMEEALTADA